jgi:hypothetical protein
MPAWVISSQNNSKELLNYVLLDYANDGGQKKLKTPGLFI